MKLHVMYLAKAAGVVGALCFGLATLAAMMGIPGFMPFAQLLLGGYGFYGYSISGIGIFIGAFWGFVEGFVWVGAFGLIYNMLLGKRK